MSNDPFAEMAEEDEDLFQNTYSCFINVQPLTYFDC